MNIVSVTSGPAVFILSFFNLFIAGIIFFSSEFFLNSLLCGLRPRIPIFGLLKLLKYHEFILTPYLRLKEYNFF